MRLAVVSLLAAPACAEQPAHVDPTVLGWSDQPGVGTDPLPPPHPALTLSTSPPIPGEVLVVSLQGPAPGFRARLYASTQIGPAPACPPELDPTCLDILDPIALARNGVADATGLVQWSIPVPETAPPGAPAMQAVVRHQGSLLLSNVVDLVFQEPDASGLDVRPQNPTCVILDGQFPRWLSETGCVDASDPGTPVEAMIPFGVNMPLFSDYADKERWLAIPDGTSITIDPASGDFVFPPGTVLMKRFSRNGIWLETRLLAQKSDGSWAAQAYAWDLGRTDAERATGDIVIGTEEWTIPSQGQCSQCHTGDAAGALGPEVVQLNGDLTYPQTGRTANQLTTLEAIGVIEALPDDPAHLDALPAGLGDANASLEDRSRAYLHANCNGCHRPAEVGKWDARWTTPFADQGICDVMAQDGPFLTPGDPDASDLVFRQETQEQNKRMPPLGRSVVHTEAMTVLRDWITNLDTCP